MQYQKAKRIADRIVELFSPHCEIINIAGSVRRMKPEVKDIEIVAIARREVVKTDLLGGEGIVISEGFANALNLVTASVVKGKLDGRYMQVILKGTDALKMDLFMPEPHDYYRQFAMRTGSAAYSAKVIASGWVKNGWCGSDHGLRRMSDCISSKYGWKCINTNGQVPPSWKNEEEFFAWLNVPWIPPERREVK